MKRKNLHNLMLTGIASGLLTAQVLSAEAAKNEKAKPGFLELIAQTGGNITEKDLTEEELLEELNPEGIKVYNSLTPDGKKLALNLASRACNGNNDCKGQNACATDKNSCEGKGSCKGQTKCAFSDKNHAVKMAAKIMAEKRMKAQNNE